MASYRKIQNRLDKLKIEIMDIEQAIESAVLANKPYFANRLRMMIEKKLEKISSLSTED